MYTIVYKERYKYKRNFVLYHVLNIYTIESTSTHEKQLCRDRGNGAKAIILILFMFVLTIVYLFSTWYKNYVLNKLFCLYLLYCIYLVHVLGR
jgi:hypothetical protein